MSSFHISSPNAMSRAAKDIGDGDFGGALNYSEAIIAGCDVAVGNVNNIGTAYMYAVGVGAIAWSRYFEFVASEIFGEGHGHVESFAVQ